MTHDAFSDCHEVLDQASLYLDGRLPASERQAVQDHLRSCPRCVPVFQDLGRLSRAVHNLPMRAAPADLTAAIRQQTSSRRAPILARLGTATLPHRGLSLAAGLLLLGGTWWLGYGMGQRAPSVESATVPSPESAPTGPAAPRLEKRSPQAPDAVLAGTTPDLDGFQSAAHSLARDVALITAVPPVGRKPLLATQIEYFALGPDAHSILQHGTSLPPNTLSLARFVADLTSALDAEAPVDWPEWQRRSRSLPIESGRLRRRADRRRPGAAPPPQLDQVLDTCAATLPPPERERLAQVLVLKRSVLFGEFAGSLSLARQLGSDGTGGGMFAIPAGIASVDTLFHAGLNPQAQRTARTLNARIQRWSQGGSTSIRVEARSSSSSSSSGGNADAMEMLEEMLREFHGPGRR